MYERTTISCLEAQSAYTQRALAYLPREHAERDPFSPMVRRMPIAPRGARIARGSIAPPSRSSAVKRGRAVAYAELAVVLLISLGLVYAVATVDWLATNVADPLNDLTWQGWLLAAGAFVIVAGLASLASRASALAWHGLSLAIYAVGAALLFVPALAVTTQTQVLIVGSVISSVIAIALLGARVSLLWSGVVTAGIAALVVAGTMSPLVA